MIAVVGRNNGATFDATEAGLIANLKQKSVWWKWRAEKSGEVYLSLRGNSQSGIPFGVFAGTDPANLKAVATGKTVRGWLAEDKSVARFQSTAGEMYYILTGSANSSSYSRIDVAINATLTKLPFGFSSSRLENGSLKIDLISGHPSVVLEVSDDLQQWHKIMSADIMGTNSVVLPYDASRPSSFVRAVTWE